MPAIPRLPVLGWTSFRGAKNAALPCVLQNEGVLLTTSGRAALLLAFEHLKLRAGDKVLLPTYHCPTMVAPVVALGGVPVFYPLGSKGEPRLEGLSDDDLRGTRILLAAHYFGLPGAMPQVRRWCDEKGIALVEDCAHALFGWCGERPIGHWGDVAIGSLTKFHPVPEGGCLRLPRGAQPPQLAPCGLWTQVKAAVDVLHAGAMYRRLPGLNSLLLGMFNLRRRLAGSAPPPPSTPVAPGDEGPEDHDGLTIDTVLSHRALTAACALVAQHLPRERIVARRRAHFERLANALSGHSGLRPLHTRLPSGSAPYVFPLWVDAPDPGYAELRRLGIPVSRWNWLWPQVPRQPGDVGIDWSHHVLQLGCHQDLDDADLDRMVAELLRLYRHGPASA